MFSLLLTGHPELGASQSQPLHKLQGDLILHLLIRSKGQLQHNAGGVKRGRSHSLHSCRVHLPPAGRKSVLGLLRPMG